MFAGGPMRLITVGTVVSALTLLTASTSLAQDVGAAPFVRLCQLKNRAVPGVIINPITRVQNLSPTC